MFRIVKTQEDIKYTMMNILIFEQLLIENLNRTVETMIDIHIDSLEYKLDKSHKGLFWDLL